MIEGFEEPEAENLLKTSCLRRCRRHLQSRRRFMVGSQIYVYTLRACFAPPALTDTGFSPGRTIDITIRTDRIEKLPHESEDLEW